MNIRIRPAKEKDLPKLVDLWLQLMEPAADHHFLFHLHASPHLHIEASLIKRMNNPDARIFVAGEENEIATGLLIAEIQGPFLTQKHQKRGYIAETAVDVAFRGQGIGKSLYIAAREWFRENEVDHIVLQTDIQNEGANAFWKKLGFEPATYSLAKKL